MPTPQYVMICCYHRGKYELFQEGIRRSDSFCQPLFDSAGRAQHA